VYVTPVIQVAVAPDPVKVQAPVNDPVPVLAKLTVPVGVEVPVLLVSVTVAEHVEPLPTNTEDGAQLTLVEVGFLGRTISVKD